MKKPSILLLTVIVSASAWAQSKNVYPDFESFKNKQPLKVENIAIEHRSNSDIMWSGGNEYKVLSDDKAVAKKLKHDYWAVETGDSLLVNGALLIGMKWYAPVLYKSPSYLYFRAVEGTGKFAKSNPAVMGVMGGAIGGAAAGAAAASKRYNYLTFLNSGETVILNKKRMKDILKNDTMLLSQYQQEQEPTEPEVIMKYLRAVDVK